MSYDPVLSQLFHSSWCLGREKNKWGSGPCNCGADEAREHYLKLVAELADCKKESTRPSETIQETRCITGPNCFCSDCYAKRVINNQGGENS